MATYTTLLYMTPVPSKFPDFFIKETLKTSPVRLLRLNHKPPLTIKEAAELSIMGPNAFYQFELAMYSSLSEAIINGLIYQSTEYQHLTIPELYKSYTSYISYKRKTFLEKTNTNYFKSLIDNLPASQVKSPIASLIEATGLSPIAFCKCLSLNPGSIHNLVTGKRSRLPLQVENCLLDLNVDFASIDELNERLKELANRT